MPRTAEPHGGLPRYHVRRIQAYLSYLRGDDGALANGRLAVARGVLVLSGALLDKYYNDFSADRYARLPSRSKQIEDEYLARRAEILARRTPSRAKKQREEDIHNLLSKYADCLNELPDPIPSSFAAYSKAVLKRPPELTEHQQEQHRQRATAYFAWCDLVHGLNDQAREKLDALGFDKYTLPALKAGTAVLKRKRLGRLMDLNPYQSFAAIGIACEPPVAVSAGSTSAADAPSHIATDAL